MKVKLRNRWFAPSDVSKGDGFYSVSGVFFKPGVHDIPDYLMDKLPDSAEIVETGEKGPMKREPRLSDFDHEAHDTGGVEKVDGRSVMTPEKLEKLAKAREAAAEARLKKHEAQVAEEE